MSGRDLLPPGETCRHTKTAAGSSVGSAAMNVPSASTPPADAPTTTMSRWARRAIRCGSELAEASTSAIRGRPAHAPRGGRTAWPDYPPLVRRTRGGRSAAVAVHRSEDEDLDAQVRIRLV